MDPYIYPGIDILVNRFNIKTPEKLAVVEGRLFALKVLEPLPEGNFDYQHLKAIHRHFFYELYDWTGRERTVAIAKGNSYFAHTQYITPVSDKLFAKLAKDNYLRELGHNLFCKQLSYYFNEINAIHPFRDGNGRTQRAFCDLLAKKARYYLNWKLVNGEEYLQANIMGFQYADYGAMEEIFKKITLQQDKLTVLEMTEDALPIS